MKSGRSNKFSRALGHLKSTTIEEKLQLQLLSEIPINNTQGIYTDEPDRTVTTTLNPNLNPLDLTQDADVNGTDTTGLFMPDGTILTEEPPGDTTYILGPMAAMFYTWSYPWTMIGYIRQSDRRMVNLGRIDGRLSDWDGSAGSAGSGTGTFSSYGQLTLEQALWFRDVQKQPGATNHPSTYNYYAFYPGPPSQNPDAFGRYPCVITGISKNRTATIQQRPTQKPINPDWGLSGYMFIKNKKTGKWEKKYYYNDGTVSSERSGEMTPDNPFYDAYQRGGGDQAAENGYSREEIIRAGNEQIQREADQQARQEYQDTLRNMSDKPLTIDDFRSAADYSAYKNGGGDAARQLGRSVEDIIRQGIQNINQYNQDPRISDRMRQDARRAELNRLMDKPPGSHTPAEKQKLIDAGLDDFVQGGKTASPLGDLAMLGATAGVVKGALALGLGGLTKLGLTGTATGIGQQAKETFVDNANDSGQYNKQLAGKLVSSIISGQPQEIKLSDKAKRDQINNVNETQFEKALQFGRASAPSANSTVNPPRNPTTGEPLKRPVLTGGWGVQGGSEVHYDPKTDTLTITSEKMLRTGQPGDKFDGGSPPSYGGGGQMAPGGDPKQTAFGDIPEPTDAQVSDITKKLMTGPLEPFMQGLSNVAQTVYARSNTSNFTGGPLPGRERVNTANTWDQIKSDPYLLQNFSDNIGTMSNTVAKGAIQGTASNTVALRKALTNLGVPQSEVEKTGGGYGQVYSQTSYKGKEIPQNLRNIINKKTVQTDVQTESYKRKRILREIKKETILPDEKKEKLMGYRPKTYGKLHAQYDTLMQKAENPASFKPMDETTWTKRDKYFNSRLSQERKNEVLDHLGTGDHYWDILCETGKKSREKGLQEKYGDYTLVRKEELAGDTLLFLVDENGKKESILQSEYSDRIARQIEEPLWEQETLNAPNDPLIKRVRNKLATQINYPDKPSPMGYPDGPTPEQVDGYHPEYGKRAAYYNALDTHSADAMPPTGDPEIDAKVNAQKTPLLKRVSAIRKKKGKPNS